MPVYMNPGTLAANGHWVADVEQALVNALAVWNEEAGSSVDLRYAGQVTWTTSQAHSVLVRFVDHHECDDPNDSDPAGIALVHPGNVDCVHFIPPPPTAAGIQIKIILQDCDGTPRLWVTSLDPTPYSMLFEGTLIHEIGHGVFGFHHAASDSVMVSGYSNHAAQRNLFDIDQNSARYHDGVTPRRARFWRSSTGSTWTSLSDPPWSFTTTMPPGLAARSGTSSLYYAVTSTAAAALSPAVLRNGWASWASVIAPAESQRKPISIARSSYSEILLSWVGACSITAGCQLRWAWSNNEGTSWTVGTISPIGTYGVTTRPVVEYDAYRDRFVLFFIDGSNGFIASASSPAVSPAFTTPVYSQPYAHPLRARFRFLGGVVFDAGGAGLLVASFDEYSPLNMIQQLAVSYSSGAYQLGLTNNLAGSGTAYRTRRPFGVGHRPDTNTVMVAFTGVDAGRTLYRTQRTGIPPALTFSAPVAVLGDAMNGADLVWVPSRSAWVAGVSGP